MALTIVSNPIGTTAYKIFAGFQPIEFIFKREDLQITSVESGSGGVQINVTTDLTGYLATGDSIYLYSEGLNYTYDAIGTILGISATEILVDIPFIQAATDGYINFRKNYFVEMMLVDKNFSDANKLPFVLQSDGDAEGNVSIDVSVINDLNQSRGAIADGLLNGVQEFEVKYREVYTGVSNSYTLIDNKLFVVVYVLEHPDTDVILNQFDVPKIYLGYPEGLVIAHAGSGGTTTLKMDYDELNINKELITSGALNDLNGNLNGLHMWAWPPTGRTLFKGDFSKWVASGNPLNPYWPEGFLLGNYNSTIIQEGNKARLSITTGTGIRAAIMRVPGELGLYYSGTYIYEIYIDAITGTPELYAEIAILYNSAYPDPIIQNLVEGLNIIELTVPEIGWGQVSLVFRDDVNPASVLISSWNVKTSVGTSDIIDDQTEYINFKLGQVGIYDFRSPDFASPDFVTQ